ncbi:MAG: vitamin K epoxide reductase family protein [Nanoarchaeota archaeon]
MKIKKYDVILGLLIITEIALSVYIGFSAQGDNFICNIGSSCDSVQNSIYGTLFGMKLAWFGAICFSVLLILFLIARFNRKMYWLFFLATIVGALMAIYFISIQAFVLNQYCTSCLIVDGIAVLMFVIVFFEYLDFKREIKRLEKKIEEKIIR